MVLPFKRKNALLNQQHLGGKILCGFLNTKRKLTGKKKKVVFACKMRMNLNSANCKFQMRTIKKRG